jgi:hypothetical protein
MRTAVLYAGEVIKESGAPIHHRQPRFKEQQFGASLGPVGRNLQNTEAIARQLRVEPQVADFASLQGARDLARFPTQQP